MRLTHLAAAVLVASAGASLFAAQQTPTTHEHEAFFVCVPDGDAVVAFDFVNEVEAALFVKVQDGFGVGA